MDKNKIHIHSKAIIIFVKIDNILLFLKEIIIYYPMR
jgi:hypothetical protein